MTTLNVPSKSILSPARRRLLELMQRTNFGRIERLRIERGEPIMDPPPWVLRDVKLGADNTRPETQHIDFALKKQVADLFCEFDVLGDGMVETIVIKHGLPFSITIETRI